MIHTSLAIAAVAILCLPPVVPAETTKLELEGATAEVYKTASGDDLYLYLFVPEGHDPAADRRPAAVFFFGGGWNGGSPTQFEPHARYLASRGMVAALADYRVKRRQNTTPRECVADGKSAVRYLRQHAGRLGIDPARIAAGGGSAGGHVAASTGTLPKLDEPTDDATISSRSNALLLFNPVYDNGPEGGWGHDRVEEYWRDISPAHNIDARTPPAIVFLGEQDDLVPVETARRFQARMKTAGVESVLYTYPDQSHGFFNERKGGTGIFLDTVRKMDAFLVELGFLEGAPSEAQVNAASTTRLETRPVTDELREALERIPAPGELVEPETLSFPVQEVRFLRVLIRETGGGTQPGIDELELFAPGGEENLALAERGAVATASSVIPGYEAIHRIEHLNDGRYGNDHSWIAASRDGEWAQIEFPGPTRVARLELSRDRKGEFRDRQVEAYDVLVSEDGREWRTVAHREGAGSARARRFPFLPVERLPERSWEGFLHYAFLRERATWSALPADDHLSPLRVDRPATPGGEPYWGRIARLAPLERVLVLFEELIERLERQGLDVSAERAVGRELRRKAATTPDSEALYLEARMAKRRLFLRDPALAPLERILFAKRHPFLESHNYSEHLDGVLEPGGGIHVLEIPRDDAERLRPDRARIRQLFDGSEGIVREPIPDHDASTIYFAYRPERPEVEGWESYWHLHAMEVDGSNPRQLTEGPFHDFDATCLPDGGLAFNSTRCKVRFLCWRPQAYVLHRMDSDGANIQRLSHSNLSEWKPSVMRSGRILWTRSEYLDKGADFGHTLWSIRPDGTHPELVFGNNTPNCYSQAHEVPGTQELVCTLMSHGDHQGPIALIDLTRGPSDTGAITSITPDARPHYQMSRSHHDSFRDPYPVSRDHFLVSHNPDDQHLWGLYVIDRYGNREVLYVDPEISSKHPRPLRPHPRPPVLPSGVDPELASQGLGHFIVQDVYEGLGSSVARGRARYLRVAEEVPARLEPLDCGQFRADHPPFTDFYASPTHLVHGPTTSFLTRTPNAPLAGLRTNHDWPELVSEVEPGLYRVREDLGWPSYVAKASLGIVPIDEDGSASFLAPAGRVLYFQLLDEEFDELQRMRSVVQLQPGEQRSCIGCHEHRSSSPARGPVQALREAPLRLQPPPWGTEPFDFQRVVQPVLDASCTRCHDGSQPGRSDLRGELDETGVPASYRALIEGGWVHFFDFTYGMRHFKAEPLSFGTSQSELWRVLADEAHEEVELDPGGRRALKAWIDLNCPLWPDYQYRPERVGGGTGRGL